MMPIFICGTIHSLYQRATRGTQKGASITFVIPIFLRSFPTQALQSLSSFNTCLPRESPLRGKTKEVSYSNDTSFVYAEIPFIILQLRLSGPRG